VNFEHFDDPLRPSYESGEQPLQKTATLAIDTPFATEPATDARAQRSCAACPHDRDAHDRIGTRFCAATTAGRLSRGCACVGEARASATRPR
jgi:hypothetical protein